ncbi:hypothetical protein KSP40_PGU017577 [Platanthera guangdongensis]|uniref:Uncharacterized protein n=1 Tax=Platanthera guangdongensis TaxID=2320717 RepID=A0ABR2LHJ7_9ASPA
MTCLSCPLGDLSGEMRPSSSRSDIRSRRFPSLESERRELKETFGSRNPTVRAKGDLRVSEGNFQLLSPDITVISKKQRERELLQRRVRRSTNRKNKIKVSRVFPDRSMDGIGGSNGGVDAGITGKVILSPREPSASVDLTDRVHLLPCVIKQNGVCPVSHYFKPRKSDIVADDLTVEEAFFRGRKLLGVTVPIPDGYRGIMLFCAFDFIIVLLTRIYLTIWGRIYTRLCVGEEENRGRDEFRRNSWESLAEFQNLTYWNHDSLPAKHDPIMRSFHWFAVADAVS